MPKRGKDWDQDVKEFTRLMRRSRSDLTYPQLAVEVDQWVTDNDLDPDGRTVTAINVSKWSKDVRTDDTPWSFIEATPEEIKLVSPVYRYAVSIGDKLAWPTRYEAAWYVRISTLLDGCPFSSVYRLGKYAAGTKGEHERQLAMALMDYVGRRAELKARAEAEGVARVSTVPAPREGEPSWGGTAIADWDTAASDPFA